MAFGDVIAAIGGSFFEPDSQAASMFSLAGGAIDLMRGINQNSRAQGNANAQSAQQQQIQSALLQMSQQQYADDRAMRDRVLTRVSQLDEALKGTLERLGPRVGVKRGDIFNNYTTFRSQILDDYNRSLDRISSQGFADSIRRGMDRSTQMTDERRQLADAAAANLPRLDQAAFDAAIARSRGFADSLNYGRGESLDEMKAVYAPAITAETGLISGNGPGIMQNAANNQVGLTNRADAIAADSQTFLGDAVGRFNETIAPNAGFALTGRGTFTTPRDREMEELQAELASLRARVGG